MHGGHIVLCLHLLDHQETLCKKRKTTYAHVPLGLICVIDFLSNLYIEILVFQNPYRNFKKFVTYCKNFKPKILPYKIFTMTAKCWMLEKSWDELVAFNFRNIFFLECPFSGSCFCWKRCCFLKKLSAINRDGKKDIWDIDCWCWRKIEPTLLSIWELFLCCFNLLLRWEAYSD